MGAQLGLHMLPGHWLARDGLCFFQVADVVELLQGLDEFLVLLDGQNYRGALAFLVNQILWPLLWRAGFGRRSP